MRPLLLLLILSTLGCGDDGGAPVDAKHDPGPDGDPSCQALGAVGQFIKRAGNPRLVPGQAFTDGKLDTAISDPDTRWDATAGRWHLYYGTSHAMTFGDAAATPLIRHASSADRMTWTVDDAPALAAATDAAAWDHAMTAQPTVVFNPDAPADRRYLMLYTGANSVFPGYGVPDSAIGAAFSADGITFTRISATDSPHAKAGLVLLGKDAYPTAVGAIVSDPEVVVVNGVYHLFFASFACKGTSCGTPDARGISHATSADGLHWSVVEAPVRSLLRASADLTTGGAQPSVIYDATHCRWELWLSSDAAADTTSQPAVATNTAGVWHADSSDGSFWHINYAFARDLPWATGSGEHVGMQAGADVGASGNGRIMVYVGLDDQNVPAGFTLPARSGGTQAAVTVLNVATRDLP